MSHIIAAKRRYTVSHALVHVSTARRGEPSSVSHALPNRKTDLQTIPMARLTSAEKSERSIIE